MDIEQVRDVFLSKKGATEDFPFDENTLVFKVMGKMFGLVSLERSPTQMNVKCDPEKALELREEHPEDILPGYHMNKKHWNSVLLEGGLEDSLIAEMIAHSYVLVVKGLRKKEKEELENY